MPAIEIRAPKTSFNMPPVIYKYKQGRYLYWAGQSHRLNRVDCLKVWIGKETAESLGQLYMPERKQFATARGKTVAPDMPAAGVAPLGAIVP